ncbi:amino acid dehydrogenase [Thioclava sp. SK-1]|uniref:NAD(P)/FAD-dependent oxidoreductase n=1 Tax=Thioclava sp. SK-1 TaxID=1889770 RepID=UPI000824C00A|nr:FAD-dependent oxidoreductase [Thioclava sp. SK-1]OCX60990.1 amino acid dehydrogenase [Thioclava sp. SK-1]
MSDIVILGAGMVGIGTALALQEAGHAVTVLDRKAPGHETSFGNAGVIQSEAAEPYAIPRDWTTIWSYLTGRSNDVVWHYRDLPSILMPLWRYFRASARDRHAVLSQSYAPLIARATGDHDAFIGPAGAQGLIRKTGMAELYDTARSFDAAAQEMERMRSTWGVRGQLLTGAELRAGEPGLRRTPQGAVLWPDTWSTRDPGALVTAYADLFVKRGGEIVLGDAESLRHTAAGWTVRSQGATLSADHVVVALGPWSPDLLSRFGYRIPMVRKRGYHQHFQIPTPLSRPYVIANAGVVMGSMTKGLRITTGAELVRVDAPAQTRQLQRGAQAAAQWVELGEPVGARWFGHRPCLPDMVPLVGPAPRHAGLWFNFGHGHQGLTLGPTTGRILAQMIAGDGPDGLQALTPKGRV